MDSLSFSSVQILLASRCKAFRNIFLQADIASDASGRAFAGVVDFPTGMSKITSGEFQDDLLGEEIQVKEAEALRATI